MQYEATYRGVLTIIPSYPGEVFDHDEVIEAASDRVADELAGMSWVIDPILSGSFARGEIEVTITVDCPSFVVAAETIDSTVRTAFHAAEIGTPNWPNLRVESFLECVRPATDDDLIDA